MDFRNTSRGPGTEERSCWQPDTAAFSLIFCRKYGREQGDGGILGAGLSGLPSEGGFMAAELLLPMAGGGRGAVVAPRS